MDHELRFSMDSRQEAFSDGEKVLWKYHIVLEHNGMIFDLDQSENPVPLPAADYFKKQFPDEFDPAKERWWVVKVHAYIFPGEEFLTLPLEIAKSCDLRIRIMNFNKGVPLADAPAALKGRRFAE